MVAIRVVRRRSRRVGTAKKLNSKPHIPDHLTVVLRELYKIGRPRLVGGCVRDALLGIPCEDIDIEVKGVSFDELSGALRKFGATDVVGRSFGTIKLRMRDQTYDFSLPRRESKTGAGHRGFKADPDPDLSDRDAASRRDFTINSMAWDPQEETLIDPFHGKQDLENRILRHTSQAFVEDPLRVLRAMQLAARFDLQLAPETAELGKSMSPLYRELSLDRVWGEWDKWATRSIKPSRGLQVLHSTEWLGHFPEIAALEDTPQDPEWHPEGDVLTHTACCLDALVKSPHWLESTPARRRILSFAVLAHDLGKPATTELVEKAGRARWISPRHAHEGLRPTESLLERIKAPHVVAPSVLPLVKFHLAHHSNQNDVPSDAQIRRLARKLSPASVDDLCEVMLADARGRPPRRDPELLTMIEALRIRATELDLQDRAPKPIVQGRPLLARGLKPGPSFSPILQEAFEAQLDGAFFDEDGSSKWLDSRLRSRTDSD